MLFFLPRGFGFGLGKGKRRLRSIFLIRDLPSAQPLAQFLHHPVGVSLAAVLRVGEDGADAVRDAFGENDAVGRRVVASGDGVLAEGLAGGEDGSLVTF